MKLTFLDGVNCTPDRGRCLALDSARFLDFIADPEKWPSEQCVTEDDKLAGQGFVLAQYAPGATTKQNTALDPDSTTDLLCFDVDGMTIEQLRAAVPLWAKTDCAIYSTWKHTPEASRLRVLVRLSRPISNYSDSPFKHVYGVAAMAMGIAYDWRASNRANFYFGPQHKPGGASERHRFTGPPLDVDAMLRVQLPETATGAAEPEIDTVANRPEPAEVKALVKKLKKRRKERDQLVGIALSAVLAGDRFAPEGSVHNTTAHVAFELCREFPHLDADWFAEKYLAPCWLVMWPKEPHDKALTDWRKCVESAARKHADTRAARAAERSAFEADQVAELTDDELLRAQAACKAQALIAEYRGNYYVYDPREAEYRGPVRSSGVATAFRQYVAGVPTVSELEFREGGSAGLKSATKLTHEYGREIDAVHYYAKTPQKPWTDNAICVRAYTWNDFEPVYHRCVDELLRSMAGDRYDLLEAWLFKLRDLSQPLPALTLVGKPGTWKSRLCQTVSRFWGDRDAATACRAEHVLRRFSGPLLNNPVIWSDEALATSEMGKSMPERYRESISELAHQVERKGIDPVTLHTATRHVISVNDDDKVFSTEVDSHSVEATIARFLVIHVADQAVRVFEQRWDRTRELARMRSGLSLLEHVRWIEDNRQHVSQGRFFVRTDTDPEMLRRARFADETLTTCMLICIEALLAEQKHSRPGQLERLPLVVDDDGRLRISPTRIVELWPDSKLTAGSGLRKPTAARVGRMLGKAGFRHDESERANNNRWRAWVARHDVVRSFVHVEGTYTWSEIQAACKKVFKMEIASFPTAQ